MSVLQTEDTMKVWALRLKRLLLQSHIGLPRWLRGNPPVCQNRRLRTCGFSPWVGTIPCTRKRQPTPVFLPGESPWKEEPGGLESRVVAESQTWLSTHIHRLESELNLRCYFLVFFLATNRFWLCARHSAGSYEKHIRATQGSCLALKPQHPWSETPLAFWSAPLPTDRLFFICLFHFF